MAQKLEKLMQVLKFGERITSYDFSKEDGIATATILKADGITEVDLIYNDDAEGWQ